MGAQMKALHDKIRKEGVIIGEEILKVDSFLNHQLDVAFLDEVAKTFYEKFSDRQVDKILTVEVSGIAIATLVAQYFEVPVVFAKKLASKTMKGEMYEAEVHSFTKKINYSIRIAKKYLKKDEHVLLIDDFLAKGQAALGLVHICQEAGAVVEGIGVVIEKDFQQGGALLREQGLNLVSLARIVHMNNSEIEFWEENDV